MIPPHTAHQDYLQDEIAKDPSTHGSMIVPVVLGADKTTVSVATGNQESHPVYMSVVPLAFLPIPKGSTRRISVLL